MFSSSKTNNQLALMICSYGPDFDRCSRLCSSIDAFVGKHVRQFLVVPNRDRKLFSPLRSESREVVSAQDVLPARFFHLPLFKKWWLDHTLWPVRGWIMQQLTKLSADAVTDCEHIVFVDSDIEFITPLQIGRFFQNGALRLHRKPMTNPDDMHCQWHRGAAELLGLDVEVGDFDYIGPLATWRRSNLIKLKEHIQEGTQRPWFESVGRRLTVSEYTLYGVFVERILGLPNSGHFANADDLCHCLWFGDEANSFLKDFNYERSPQAVLLQSNIGLDDKEVNLLMRLVRNQLAAVS
jgi:hypothetical protein